MKTSEITGIRSTRMHALASLLLAGVAPAFGHTDMDEAHAHAPTLSVSTWVPRAADGHFLLARAEVATPKSLQPKPSSNPSPLAIFEQFGSRVRTRRDSNFLYIESDSIPAHRMMVGITAWQQQVPLPQTYTGANAWRLPLHPVPAQKPLSAKNGFFRGAIAIAANGVPIFNPIKNDGRTDTFLAGELDEFGGHCGRADDYHYHTAPVHLQDAVGSGQPVAFALDGYPIYGFTEPDGSAVNGLDAFNGHSTANLGYHYHASRSYPYLNGGFHGEVTERGGQVDPQPDATPIRPALPPWRGARITGFSTNTDGRTDLQVQVGTAIHHVRYTPKTGGNVEFEFASPDGTVRRETYSQSQRRGGGRNPNGAPPDRNPDRSERPPRPDGASRGPAQDDPNRLPWIRVHAPEMDTNQDGILTRAELDAEVARTFVKLDRDENDAITAAEARGGGGGGTAMSGFVGQHFSEVDEDGDGIVTRIELAAVASRMFRRADADSDGLIPAAEFSAMKAAGKRTPAQ